VRRAAPSVGEYRRIYDPSAGRPEPWYVNDHTLFRDRTGLWHLIGITHAEPAAPFDEKHLEHATAPALLGPWTRQAFALSADPEAGETQLWAPHVVEHDGRWWMFYCAGGAQKTAYRLHLATSTDAWSWTRHPANPLVVDGYEARDPMVLRTPGGWRMYYTATLAPEGGSFIVAAAESPDLVRWSGRRVVYQDPLSGTMAGPTESPFVFERDGRFYLSIGPDWQGLLDSHARTGRYDLRAYRRTRLLASDDPLRFELAGQVATLDSHAAEVVVDESGGWWVSHCGWGQGGVYLAPLCWP
jgi:sucrose-6-phosphate hydrolase SacC (GH32 family)